MKKIKLISAVSLAGALVLSGCGHTHTFAAEWLSNDDQHWHASTCGHNVVDSLGNHVDSNLDGLCDVCDRKIGDPVIDPAVTSVSISGSVAKLDLGQTVTLTANVIAVGGANNGVDWSVNDPSLASLSDNPGKTVTITAKKEGKLVVTAKSKFDPTKSAQVEIQILDRGFDPSWIDDEGYTYSKTFPVDAIKQFIGEGSYDVVEPAELEGGCYYKSFTDGSVPYFEVIVDGIVDEDYKDELIEEGFDRVYVNDNDEYEAVDPTGIYTVATSAFVNAEQTAYVAPTYIDFLRSADVWCSSTLTSDEAWDELKIVNKEAEDIEKAKAAIADVPFVKLGEEYQIEWCYDYSEYYEIIEMLEEYGLIDETSTEEEIEEWLEYLEYTGPEEYLAIYDFSVARPFEGYADTLDGAGFEYIETEQGAYYEATKGLNAVDLVYFFDAYGNEIDVYPGVATLNAFPKDYVDDFVKDVIGSKYEIPAYEETEGALFQAQVYEDEMDIIVDEATIEEFEAYMAKLELEGFDVVYTPASEDEMYHYFPHIKATLGKIVIELYLSQEAGDKAYLDYGMVSMYVYGDDSKHEEQGIYLPEETKGNLKLGSMELVPEIVELGETVNLTWSSADDSIATVEDGVVTFVAAGEVDITVTSDVAIPEVGGFYSATTHLVISEKPDFAPVLADLNATLASYGGTEVVTDEILPEIDCADYTYFDGFLSYGCYVIQGTLPTETNESYAAKVTGLGFDVVPESVGYFYSTEEYDIAFNYFPEDKDGPAVFQVCIYFLEEEKEPTYDNVVITDYFSNEQVMTSIETDLGGEIVFKKGSSNNDPKCYSSGGARLYSGNTVTFTAPEGSYITGIEFEKADYGSKSEAEITADVGDYEDYYYYAPEGGVESVTFTVGANGQWRFSECTIEYDGEGGGGGGGGGESADFEALLDKVEKAYSVTLSYDSEDDSYFSEEPVCSSSSKTMMQVVTEAVNKLPAEFSEEFYEPYEDYWDEEETDPGVFACYVTEDWSVVIQFGAWIEGGQIYLQIVVYELGY